jgi:predicted TIM-barrel fold metal-dependent hydrolase
MSTVLDIHAHLFHPRWYPRPFIDSLTDGYVSGLVARGRQHPGPGAIDTVNRMLSDTDGSLTVRLMDKLGIAKKVILILDWGVELGEASCSIEEIHKEILGVCANFSDRLLGFAGVDPRRPQAAEIVERAFDFLGAKGLKLHPTGQWELSDERTHRVVDLAVRRGLPVLVHVGKTLDILNDHNAHPSALIRLARAFPQGKFIAGHSGFELFRAFTTEPNPPRNLYYDISAWQPLLRDRVQLLSMLTELVGAFPERVCYGSDGPFFTYNLASSEGGWISFVKDFLAGLPSGFSSAKSSVLSGQNVFDKVTIDAVQ